jgi:ribosomal protein S6--L-glutamate ligase
LVHPKDMISNIRNSGLHMELNGRKTPGHVIMPRLGATISDSVMVHLRHLELMGMPMVNNSRGIGLARNQYLTLQALAHVGLPVPDSYFVTNGPNFNGAVERLGGYPVVVKPLSGRQGQGVTLVESPLTAKFLISHLLDKRKGMLIQEYIPPKGRTDIRVIVLGGHVAGAMELRPRQGDFRANIHLKGQSNPATLSRDLEQIAISSAKILGLEISGIDIIINHNANVKVLEVNYSPGFKGLEACTGVDMAGMIIGHVLNRYGDAL